MDRHDDHLPEDLHEIAGRLEEARTRPTAIELDEMRSRVQRRAQRAGSQRRGRLVTVLRMNFVAVLLTGGLVLTSGVGAVLASGAVGGNHEDTYKGTTFDKPKDSSECEYEGPSTETVEFESSRHHSTLTVTTVRDCDEVTTHFECREGISEYRFTGLPVVKVRGSSITRTAPTGATGLSVTFDGTTVNLPLSRSRS
jgi:hypothetical protein